MIEWLILPRGRNSIKLQDGTIKISNCAIVFTKQAILQIVTRISNGKSILLGIENNTLYLKDSIEGYKIQKSGNNYAIVIGYKVIETIINNGIRPGIYSLEKVDDSVYKCIFIEEINE